MCLAVPLRLTQVIGNEATGEALGMSRAIRVDFIQDPKPGDYVIVHAGFAIERIGEQEAMKDIEAWTEVQHALS